MRLLLVVTIVILAGCSTTAPRTMPEPIRSPMLSLITVQDRAGQLQVEQHEHPFDTVSHILWRLLLDSHEPSLVISPPKTRKGMTLRLDNAESYYLRLMPDHHRILVETVEVHWPSPKALNPVLYVNGSLRLETPDGSTDADLLRQWSTYSLRAVRE